MIFFEKKTVFEVFLIIIVFLITESESEKTADTNVALGSPATYSGGNDSTLNVTDENPDTLIFLKDLTINPWVTVTLADEFHILSDMWQVNILNPKKLDYTVFTHHSGEDKVWRECVSRLVSSGKDDKIKINEEMCYNLEYRDRDVKYSLSIPLSLRIIEFRVFAIRCYSNVALGKPTTYSGGTAPSFNATDGDSNSFITVNDPNTKPWFEIDVADDFYILKTQISFEVDNKEEMNFEFYGYLKAENAEWEKFTSNKFEGNIAEEKTFRLHKMCFTFLKTPYRKFRISFNKPLPVKLSKINVFAVNDTKEKCPVHKEDEEDDLNIVSEEIDDVSAPEEEGDKMSENALEEDEDGPDYLKFLWILPILLFLINSAFIRSLLKQRKETKEQIRRLEERMVEGIKEEGIKEEGIKEEGAKEEGIKEEVKKVPEKKIKETKKKSKKKLNKSVRKKTKAISSKYNN